MRQKHQAGVACHFVRNLPEVLHLGSPKAQSENKMSTHAISGLRGSSIHRRCQAESWLSLRNKSLGWRHSD